MYRFEGETGMSISDGIVHCIFSLEYKKHPVVWCAVNKKNHNIYWMCKSLFYSNDYLVISAIKHNRHITRYLNVLAFFIL